MKLKGLQFLSLILVFIHTPLFAANYVVTTTDDSTTTVPSGSLREAMLSAFFASDSSFTITFADNLGTIKLVDHLPVLSSYQSSAVTFTVNGGVGNTIDGDGLYQAFFVTPTNNNGTSVTGTISGTISNLTFSNCSVTGGDGQDGGGGAMGAGGAIFVDKNATVTGSSLTFSNCSAVGGGSQINISTKSGGGGGGARGGLGGAAHASDTTTSHGAGGGGGFASSGGSATATISSIEGGGGGGANMLPGQGLSCDGGNYDMTSGTPIAGGGGAMGGSGQNASAGGGGGSGSINGSAVGGNGGSGASSSAPVKAGGYGAGGGGGGQSRGSGGAGGIGGGGGGTGLSVGGAGNDFGGGGGSIGNGTGSNGGAGGFGGGGGGAGGGIDGVPTSGGNGGNGGFGGGGGNAQRSDHGYSGGVSSYAGGTGGTGSGGCGGGGAGLGGAVFYRNGGALSLNNCTFENNSVTGGVTSGTGGATNGSAYGTDLFIQAASTLTTIGDVSFKGTIHSDGDWTKDGAGALYLYSANTYTGTTTLSAGSIAARANNALGTGSLAMQSGTTLDVGNSITVSNNINLAADANMQVASGTGTVSGIIGGAGGLTKRGAGVLILSGANTYAGITTVAAGTLKVNGSIANDVAIQTAAILSGNGTVNGSVNSSGGTISPGGSIGTMIITGNLTLDANSILQIQLSPTAASKVSVTGNAALNGTLNLAYENGYYTNASYTILSAAPISGTFTGITSNYTPAGIKSSFTISGNNVFLNLVNNGLASVATTPLAATVGTFMDKVGAGNPTAAQLQLLGALQNTQDANSLNFALTEIAPTITAPLWSMTMLWLQQDQIETRLSGLRNENYYVAGDDTPVHGLWLRPFYEGGKQMNLGTLLGYRANTTGLVLGLDKEITRLATMGLAISYAKSVVKSINFYNNYTNIKTYLGTLYGAYKLENAIYCDWLVSGGVNHYNGQRIINIPPTYAVAQAAYNGQQYLADVVLSKDYVKNQFIVSPQVNADFIYLRQHSFTETGAGSLGLNVNMDHSDVFTVGTGVKVTRPYKCKKHISFTPEAHVLVYYDLKSGYQNATSAFVTGGPTLVTSAVPGRLTGQFGVSATFYRSENLDFKIEYDFMCKNRYTNNVAYVNVRYLF